MKVITLAAGKGGVGKTLLTASLAALAQRECDEEGPGGGKVGIVDLDPQGSLTQWYNMRPPGSLTFVKVWATVLGLEVAGLRGNDLRYLFIDTPPGHADYINKAIALADLTVVPIKPGELDYAATSRTLRKAAKGKRSVLALPNDATFRSRAMGQTIAQLKDAGVPMLPPVHHRVNMMLRGGRTVTETDPASRGAQELAQVWSDMKAMLDQGEEP